MFSLKYETYIPPKHIFKLMKYVMHVISHLVVLHMPIRVYDYEYFIQNHMIWIVRDLGKVK